MLVWIKSFLKIYKVYLILFVMLWAGVAVMEFYVISPLKQDNRRQKNEVKKLEKENKALYETVLENDALIIIKEKKILKLEALEKYYKNKALEKHVYYEKEKTSYVSRPIAERRRVFAKLANE